ncbi:ABC transporter substrate-binding protein (plasmid) [Photobacterium sp. GJ3]|uniref:ABC transporter substrate-binding protein n=1 Tax=Photobacterium sp. GJ3 TaxID=2829502 RepID=UPI001B8BEAED|nr:ABC transporter substrate-binding protein [Photobacterium sp. GJ3]QUJ69488.1 ABC transporter substrate-binding protein [Photobacterium sp. GJ3]
MRFHIVLLFILGCFGAIQSANATIQISDVLNRQITLTQPAQRIFLGFYFEDYLAIAGPDAYQKVAIFPRKSWEDYRQSQWTVYTKALPEILTIADSGSIYTGTFQFEKLLLAKPDVALLAAWQYKSLADKIPLLEQAGIQVVVVDFNAQTLEKHLLSIRVIGQVMGTEARANAIANEYEQSVKDVETRVTQYLKTHPKRRVYVEIGTGGSAEFGKSYSNTMWGNLLAIAGANNIASGQFQGSAHLSPEYVLSRNPEVIFITGAHWSKHTHSALMGHGTSKTESMARYTPYLNRKGWSHLDAVKNNAVYGMYHSGTRTLYDHIFLQFLAKSIYPEAFSDLEPDQNLHRFFQQYMPVALDGTFMMQVEG